MYAGIQDLKIEQGATFSATLIFQDSLLAYINLSGSTFKGQIRRAVTDDLPLANFRFTILDQTATPGRVQFFLLAADTAAMLVRQDGNFTTVVNKYVYDIQRTLPDLSVYRVLQGSVVVSPEVTR